MAVCSNLSLETAELEMETAEETEQQSQAHGPAAMPFQPGFICGLDSVFAFSTQSDYCRKLILRGKIFLVFLWEITYYIP